MANDIQVAISGSAIKNGTAVVTCSTAGEYSVLNTYVNNKPVISDIESKYDTRLDNPRYYTGDSPS